MKTLVFFLMNIGLFCGAWAWWNDGETSENKVLVFGGNGFLGADTVNELLAKGITNITIVNRGGRYWDSEDRIFSKVKSIKCDRNTIIKSSCEELVEELKGNKYDFVIDFSVFKPNQMNETLQLLKDKVGLYVLISPDQIYDLCKRSFEGFTTEEEAVRLTDESVATELKYRFRVAHERFEVEELLVAQQQDGGFPYVIFRLPDVFGPRDTTHRWWIYQAWLRLSPLLTDHPIHIPNFLATYNMSFVYSRDVAQTIAGLLSGSETDSEEVVNQAFNLAWPNAFTMTDILEEIKINLKMTEQKIKILDEMDHQNHFYTYPSVRTGPLDVAKATKILKWSPTDWTEAVRETVAFFEEAMSGDEFHKQRDEIVQIIGKSLYDENLMKFYEALEEAYKIDLKHFKYPRDEL